MCPRFFSALARLIKNDRFFPMSLILIVKSMVMVVARFVGV